VKFLSRFVQIESSPATVEYGLIAGAMALALAAIMPILASSIAAALASGM
jgi:Flp pilus assembly pilin Flp